MWLWNVTIMARNCSSVYRLDIPVRLGSSDENVLTRCYTIILIPLEHDR